MRTTVDEAIMRIRPSLGFFHKALQTVTAYMKIKMLTTSKLVT